MPITDTRADEQPPAWHCRTWNTLGVHLGFIDESYNADFMFVACAVATEDQWADLASEFATIRSDNSRIHGVARDAEFHGHELMGGSGDWQTLRGKHREATGIYVRCLSAMSSAGVRVIVRGIDVGRLNARYRYPRPPYGLALQYTLERLNEHMMRRCGAEQVCVTADEVHTRADHLLEFTGYQVVGTPGYRASNLARVDSLKFGDSRLVDGLQAVDLAVYLYRRNHAIENEGELEHPRASSARRRLYSILSPMLLPESGISRP